MPISRRTLINAAALAGAAALKPCAVRAAPERQVRFSSNGGRRLRSLDMQQNELNKHRAAAIRLRRKVDGKISLTRLGGLPALPSGIEWPRQLQSNSPLHFLAQIDLSRLPSTPLNGASNAPALPKSGVLFFFADMVEEMLWNDNGGPFATTRVIFANQAGPERSPPDDMPEILHGFGEHAGGYETGFSVYPLARPDPGE